MRHLPLEPFQNVGVGQKAIIPRLLTGETYHGILLRLGGTTFTSANISRILVRLGGKPIIDVTGSQLATMNAYMGFTANASFLMIPFAEWNARTVTGEPIGALDTSFPYSGMSLEVTIDGAAVAPTLEAWKFVTPSKVVAKPEHLPLFRALIPSTHNIASAGRFSIPIPTGTKAGALVKRVHLFHTNITQFDLKVNGTDIVDDGEVTVLQYWQNLLTRVTQAGHFCFDPVTRDNQADAIPTLDAETKRENVFDWKVTLSAGDTIESVSELYAAIGSI